MDLADAPITIEGASGTKSRVGWALDVCDLDGDGFDDLIVSAPGTPYSSSSDYNGAIAVYYGAGSADWSAGMSLSSADVLIEEDTDHFFGAATKCTDLDGDGYLDLVTTRAEFNRTGSSAYHSTFGILGFYGSSSGWSSAIAASAADFEYSYSLGIPGTYTNWLDREFAVGDIDGDGASEILLNMSAATYPNGSEMYGEGEVWVIPGDTYSGSGTLSSSIYAATIELDADFEQFSTVMVTEDFDGDTFQDVFLGEWYFGSGLGQHGGLFSDLTYSSTPTTPDDLLTTTWTPDDESSSYSGLGLRGVFADFNDDGLTDLVLTAPFDETGSGGTSWTGAIYTYGDVASVVESTGLDEADADGMVYGTTTPDVMFGYPQPIAVGDIDGDDVVDLLVAESNTTSLSSVWAVSGKNLWAGKPGTTAEDAASMVWVGVRTAGWATAAGDFDGDGVNDVVISAPYWSDTTSSVWPGKVYIYLSSEWCDCPCGE